jgi:uncharacterized protein (DUF488 family)
MKAGRIFTIGYEQATQAEFIAALRAAGVRRVIDVRAIAASRRPGFSKTALRNLLTEEGIGYVHLRALGTPVQGREAARRGDMATLRRVYSDQLHLPEAIFEAERLKVLAVEIPSALLCYEREPACCHRTLLRKAALPDAEVVDLFV